MLTPHTNITEDPKVCLSMFALGFFMNGYVSIRLALVRHMGIFMSGDVSIRSALVVLRTEAKVDCRPSQ
jgi:hypothetical protein